MSVRSLKTASGSCSERSATLKRPVATPKLEAIVDEIEGVVHEATERELTTTEIGEMIMHRLKKLDKVAYVRFASVYMDFKDVQEFMTELKNLLKDRGKK